MKWNSFVRRQGVVTLVTLVLVCTSLGVYAEIQPAQVRILKVKGAASYSIGGVWHPLIKNLILTNGAEIKTEADGVVDFLLDSSKTALRLVPNSALVLQKLTQERGADRVITDTSIKLTKGSLVGSQRKLATPSLFLISAANSTARIRGTEYVVTANGSVTCLSGSITVRYNLPGNGGSVLVDVAAGYTFDAVTQQVVPTSPAYLKNIIADVDTVTQNAQTFKAGGATLVIKPLPVVSAAKGNNGVGNGVDPQPPGNPPVNDGPGTGPGNPGNKKQNTP